MDYQAITHHQEQTRKGEEFSAIKECPNLHKTAAPAEQCLLCGTKTVKSVTDPDIGSNGSEEFYSCDEIDTVSDEEEYFSATEDQATSNNKDIPYLDLGAEELDIASSDHNGPAEHYHSGNSLLESGDGSDNTSGYRFGEKCTWHRFSRGVARQLMPPNIPLTKVTDGEGVEMECPLVPELKLTTPEGEEYWLNDLTYYGVQGGWADSDEEEEEDESIYD